MQFRNKRHVFLNSMRMCNQGDQEFLFTIGKYLSGKFSQHGDLKKLMNKFPIWKEFVHQDLKNYELAQTKDSVFCEQLFN